MCINTEQNMTAALIKNRKKEKNKGKRERSLSRPSLDLQSSGKMGNMATEIVAFLLTISGWILVSSTLPTDYWKVSSVDGTVITTATFWSNLWKTCVTDSTGVSNCKDFPSMLALDGLCCMTACSIYAHRITTDFFDPLFVAQKAEYSYNGAATHVTARHKHSNTAISLHKEPRGTSSQFGRNAYV
ncbi:Claudin-10 [Channa argus]|uniref:Claudin n=1 Tax=Channa argus TaxID=215402 RepID=A0A6G1QVN3_CHAAH|nr:Claudin-10 [Channa argus]